MAPYRLVPATESDQAWLEQLRRSVYRDLFFATWVIVAIQSHVDDEDGEAMSASFVTTSGRFVEIEPPLMLIADRVGVCCGFQQTPSIPVLVEPTSWRAGNV